MYALLIVGKQLYLELKAFQRMTRKHVTSSSDCDQAQRGLEPFKCPWRFEQRGVGGNGAGKSKEDIHTVPIRSNNNNSSNNCYRKKIITIMIFQ